MKVKAIVSRGNFKAGAEYDLPEKEAQAAIIAGIAEPLDTKALAFYRETATVKNYQTRWRTR